MRLLDRIFAQGFAGSPHIIDEGPMLRNLQSAQLVVIDNVADYYIPETKKRWQEGEAPTASDFPNVMLPFERTFMEMRVRPQMDVMGGLFDEVGMLMDMTDINIFRERLRGNHQWEQLEINPFSLDTVKWCLQAEVYFHGIGKDGVLHAATFMLPVDTNGQIVPFHEEGKDEVSVPWIAALHTKLFVDSSLEKRKENNNSVLHYYAGHFIHPVLLALSFMHCRNVKTVEERPPLPLSKKHQKRTGRPLLRYRVLQIDHMKQILETEGGASEGGLKKALHICRGHFKHYGRDGKGLLFGKHIATVWIPMHARGAAEEGVVVKDYDVK